MSKPQLTWSLLRFFGLVLLVLSIYLIMMKTSWYWTGSSLKISTAFPPYFLLVAGLYFLFFGRAVFVFLMRENSPRLNRRVESDRSRHSRPAARRRPPEPVDPVTTLTQGETREFEAWWADNPQLKGKTREDCIALFRDHQRAQVR